MTLIEAMKESMKGKIVVSCINKEYTPKQLSVQKLSREAVMYNDCGFIKEEYKGEWGIKDG